MLDVRPYDMDHYGLSRSEYETKQEHLALEQKKQNVINEIAQLEKEQVEGVFKIMDFIEKVIHTCGGESKATFLEVSHTFIKCFTRVPLQGNLFPFLPESQENPRFHKVVSKILLLKNCVEDVRWISSMEGERGSFLMVTLKKEEKTE